MVHLDRVVVEQSLGDGAAFGDRYRCQIDPVGDIADCVNVGNGAARPFVDDDGAVFVCLDADLRETEPSRVRISPGRIHHDVGGEFLTDSRIDRVAVFLLFDSSDLGARVDLDAAAAHFLRQRDADVVVEAEEQLLAADQLDDLGAEPIENPGELDGDVTAADNDDAAGQGGQVERLVGRDYVLDAGYGRHRGMRAGGHQDLVRRVGPTVDFDRMRIDQHAPPFDQLDPAILQHAAIDLREPLDLTVLGVDQGGPVEARHGHRPAKAGGIGKGVGKLRAIDEQLLRHAAADHAGAADAAFFANPDACAVAAGAARAGDAPRSGSDREHVEIIARHRGLTPLSQVLRSSGCHKIAAPASLDSVDRYRSAAGAMDRGGCRTP